MPSFTHHLIENNISLIKVTSNATTVTCNNKSGFNENGVWYFVVGIGTYNLLATLGTTTQTETVIISSPGIYNKDIQITSNFYIFKDGTITGINLLVNQHGWGGWTVGGSASVTSTIDMETNGYRVQGLCLFDYKIDITSYTKFGIVLKYNINHGLVDEGVGFGMCTTNTGNLAYNYFGTLFQADSDTQQDNYTRYETNIASLTYDGWPLLMVGRNSSYASVKEVYFY